MDVAPAVQPLALDDHDRPGVVAGGVTDLLEQRAVAARERVQEVLDGLALDHDPVRADVVADCERLQAGFDPLPRREVPGDRGVQFPLVDHDFDVLAVGVRRGDLVPVVGVASGLVDLSVSLHRVGLCRAGPVSLAVCVCLNRVGCLGRVGEGVQPRLGAQA